MLREVRKRNLKDSKGAGYNLQKLYHVVYGKPKEVKEVVREEPMRVSSRNDVVSVLKAERDFLWKRISAIDAILVAYGQDTSL